MEIGREGGDQYRAQPKGKCPTMGNVNADREAAGVPAEELTAWRPAAGDLESSKDL